MARALDFKKRCIFIYLLVPGETPLGRRCCFNEATLRDMFTPNKQLNRLSKSLFLIFSPNCYFNYEFRYGNT